MTPFYDNVKWSTTCSESRPFINIIFEWLQESVKLSIKLSENLNKFRKSAQLWKIQIVIIIQALQYRRVSSFQFSIVNSFDCSDEYAWAQTFIVTFKFNKIVRYVELHYNKKLALFGYVYKLLHISKRYRKILNLYK